MEKKVNGFDRSDRIYVILIDDTHIVMDKASWDFIDWGIVHGDSTQTKLYPWPQIKEIWQYHGD